MGRWRRRSKHHHHHHHHHRHGDTKDTTSGNSTTQENDGNDEQSGGERVGAGNDGDRPPSEKTLPLVAPDATVANHGRGRGGKNANFNAIDKERILRYLQEYKELADRNIARDATTAAVSDESASTAINDRENDWPENDWRHNLQDGSSISAVDDEDTKNDDGGVWIGGHEFPPLNQDDVSACPFWLLPPTLNNKQRKCVHGLCVDVGLYHESIGGSVCGSKEGTESGDGTVFPRRCIISNHSDGFDTLRRGEDCYLNRPTSLPIRRCQSWYYRDHGERSRIFKGKNDQSPGQERHIFESHFVRQEASEDARLGAVFAENGTAKDPVSPNGGTQLLESRENTPVRCNTFTSMQAMGPFIPSLDVDSTGNENGDEAPLNKGTLPFASSAVHAANQNVLTKDFLVREITKMGREKIERILDQPGECLRDSQDEFNFEQMESEDLSIVPSLADFVHENRMERRSDVNELDHPGLLLVDSRDKMLRCICEIEDSNPPQIGFDLEMYNQSKYTGLTCLVQVATPAKDYVIDVLAPGVWDHVSLLAPIFADPAVVKIGHSIGSMDVPALHRDFGIFVVNAFDTYEAAWALQLKRLGLASVCRHYNLPGIERYVKLKARYQNTDWRSRPLSKDMVLYARHDIHYLIELRRLMIRDLTRGDLWGISPTRDRDAALVAKALAATLRKGDALDEGLDEDDFGSVEDGSAEDGSAARSSASCEDGYFTPGEDESLGGSDAAPATVNSGEGTSLVSAKELRMNASLMRVISQSQQACLALWSHQHEPTMRNDLVLSYMREEGGIGWSDDHTCLYEELVEWRKRVGRTVGTMPGLVCTTDLLVHVVRRRPTTKSMLRQVTYFLPELLEEEGSDILRELLQIVMSSALVKKDGKASPCPRRNVASWSHSQVVQTTVTTSSRGVVVEESSSNQRTIVNEHVVGASSARHTSVGEIANGSDTNPKYDFKNDPSRTESFGAASKEISTENEPSAADDDSDDRSKDHDLRSRTRVFSVALKVVAVVTIGAIVVVVVRKRRR